MKFRLDPRGTLTPLSPEAQNGLAGRAGDWELLSTHADLMSLIRVPATGSVGKTPRVVLTGDASGFPLSDMIAFLTQSKWSGQLRLHASQGERLLSFKEGEVRAAQSDDPADRLGEVLVRLGYVTGQQLEEVLSENPPSKVGRALVEGGMLQSHDLWKGINEQISEIFHAIVLAREGTFYLIDQQLEDKAGHNVQISTQSLLMDSIRKIDEMAHFRKRIPHGRLFVIKKRASDGKLEEIEDKMLQLATGGRTILELGQALKITEFDATKAAYGLLEGGYAAISERAASSAAAAAPAAPAAPAAAPTAPRQPAAAAAPAPGGTLEPAHVVAAFNNIFREIRGEVAKQRMDKEFIAAANAALSGEALSTSPVLKGISFDATGQLPNAQLLNQYAATKDQLGSEPVASLKQALSDVMFFLLFQAGELLESAADEDLARRVKELLATLEAE